MGQLASSLPDTEIVGERSVVSVVGRDATGDSGAGLSYRGVLGDATEPDYVLVWPAPNGRWHLVWDGTTLRSGAAGVKGDVTRLIDGERVAGSSRLTSHSASFSEADVGKRVLIREPSSPTSGTVSIAAGSQLVVGSGTAFLSEIPRESWDVTKPKSGGAIYIGRQLFVILQVLSDTRLTVKAPSARSISHATLYRKVHTEASIVYVQSPQEATLSAAATVTGTGLTVDYGTDDDAAVDLFEKVCHDNHIAEAHFQKGVFGIYDNHVFGADVSDPDWASKRRRDRRYVGSGKSKTIFRRLRDISWEPSDRDRLAAFSWIFPYNIEVSDMSFDDNVPILGVGHTAEDAIRNTTAGRLGFAMRHPWRSGFRRMGAVGYGSRDEYLLIESSYDSDGCYITDCEWEMVNSNGINPNSGLLRNFVVTGNNVGGFFSAAQIAIGSGLVGNNIFRGQKDLPNEGAVLVIESAGKISCVNTVVESVDYGSAYTTSPFQIFGSNSPTAQITIVGLRIRDVRGSWHGSTGGAVLEIEDFDGKLTISDVLIADASGTSESSRFLVIRESQGKVNFNGGFCANGPNMTIGLEVFESASDGILSGEDTLLFDGGIVSPIKVPSLAKFLRYTDITTNGSNVVPAYVNTVNISYNGTTTVELRNPATLPIGWTVVVSNAPTQRGTTRVTAAAGGVVGRAALAGANAVGVYKAFGNTWRNVR